MSSATSLYLDQNEGFAKSKSRENSMVIDAILRLSSGQEAFEGAKFSFTLTQEKVDTTADDNRITAKACCHPQKPP